MGCGRKGFVENSLRKPKIQFIGKNDCCWLEKTKVEKRNTFVITQELLDHLKTVKPENLADFLTYRPDKVILF